MKVSPPKSNYDGKQKAKPLLPLVPEVREELDKSQTATFKLYSDPTDNESAKYEFTMPYIDGNDEPVRRYLEWLKNGERVCEGLGLVQVHARLNILNKLVRAAALNAFSIARQHAETEYLAFLQQEAYDNEPDEDQKQDAFDAITVIPTENQHERHYLNVTQKFLSYVLPNKVLPRIKRYLRRECRKPADMKIRAFANHLYRINHQEIPMLPPHGTSQSLTEDEIVEIMTYAVPRSWIREMDRQGVDPLVSGMTEMIRFFERVEETEDFDPNAKKVSSGKKDQKGKSGYNSGKGKNAKDNSNKFCHLHGKGDHTTEDCRTLKKQRTERADAKKDGKSYGNKTWKNNAKKNKESTNKELATFMKETKKELNAINASLKKRKATDSSDDEGSINAYEKMDMSAFNYEDMDNLKIHSDAEDGEISV